MTELERALWAMKKPGADAKARARYLLELSNSEVHLVLDGPVVDEDSIQPQIAEEEGTTFCIVFETASDFAEHMGEAEFVMLPGRVLASMLQENGMGLLVNPGCTSAHMVEPEAIGWLVTTLAQEPEVKEQQVPEFVPLGNVNPQFITSIQTILSHFPGENLQAFLTATKDKSLILFVFGIADRDHARVAKAIGEAAMTDVLAQNLDISFPEPSPSLLGLLGKLGMEIDCAKIQPVQPVSPGMDPEKPPKLR